MRFDFHILHSCAGDIARMISNLGVYLRPNQCLDYLTQPANQYLVEGRAHEPVPSQRSRGYSTVNGTVLLRESTLRQALLGR